MPTPPPFLRSRALPLRMPPLPSAAAQSLSLPPVDPCIVSTSINASLNLISVCGFVILMQKCGYLPSNTAQVLSQVSFNLVIPCFLMSKLSKTIALQQDWRFLAMPLIALIQVFLNGMLSQIDYSAASGYLALFMVGWSPCLWTLGYQILNATSGPLQPANKNLELSLHELVGWLKELLNPPLYGILIGFLVGATPLSYLCLPAKHVFDAERTKGFLFSIGPLMASILQPILEGVNLLGSATVPLQVIVLASTLASSIGGNKGNEVARIDGTTVSLHENHTVDGMVLEGKAFWAITVIRLLVMPLISITLLIAFRHQRWLLADPLSRLILLVVAAMPTGQNLVVLAQLHPNTRPFTGVLANVVVKQYLISVVSLTTWLPIFFQFLQRP